MNDKKLDLLIDKYTVNVEKGTKYIQEHVNDLSAIVKETDGLSIFTNCIMGRLQDDIERMALQVFLEKAFLNDLKQIKGEKEKEND